MSSQAPSAQDQFDDAASRQLEAVYLTPDVVEQRDKVLALLAPTADEHALDIGCGPGLTTLALAQAVGPQGSVLGVDITQLPYADDSFDCALASQVYEYVEDVDHALKELARVVRPGGRAVLVDTDWESAVWASHDDARMRRVLETWNEHIPHPQLPRTLVRRMWQAGFTEVKVDVVPLLNLVWDPQTYSVGMMTLLGNFATGRNGLTAGDIAAWKADAKAISDEGGYFFSLNRYVFTGRRPG